MAGYQEQHSAGRFSSVSFWDELYQRTTPLPFRAGNGNQCIAVDLRNCSQDFLRKVEDCFAGERGSFRLIGRGLDYYLEVLDRDTFLNAYQKMASRH